MALILTSVSRDEKATTVAVKHLGDTLIFFVTNKYK